MTDLTNRASHFEFGQNWADYSALIDEDRISAAIESVRSLAGDLAGRSFLDIGSGSGLFSLAALRLGAADVLAVDIDENSVETTRSVLTAHAPAKQWRAEQVSVFDLSAYGMFDVVYSWGVLHHTGSMWDAIKAAAAMVKPGGTFAFALYEKTPLCGFWKVEKRLYASAPPFAQKLAQFLYAGTYYAGLIATGRNPLKKEVRGMQKKNDIHDWLGGYPYESTDKEEVRAFLARLGFEVVAERPVPIHAFGLLGSGCSEYVYRRLA